MLSGSLSFLTLADIFQIIGRNNYSGVLHVRSSCAPRTGIIYFDKGDPVNARYGNMTGTRAIYMLFGWTEGTYDFQEQEVSHIDHLIRQGRMKIVLDALRMRDDGEIDKSGPLSSIHGEIEQEGEIEHNVELPVIKGPLVDYLYVIKEESYRDRTIIVEEGTHGKWIWTIYEGNVKITRRTATGNMVLARLGEGCFIGTIRALLFGEYERNATVTSEGDVRLCLLDDEPLHHEYASLSMDFRSILLSLDHQLRSINDMTVRLSAENNLNASPKDKRMCINKFQPQNDLYLIRRGEADIIEKRPDGDFPIFSMKKDDVFGNIPFMDFGYEPRSASVMVSKDFDAVRLDTGVIMEEYKNLSCTFRNLISNLCTNLFMTTRLYGFYCQN